MPIVRTYQCEECFNRIELTLSLEQWDCDPPACSVCADRAMRQEFKPIAIGGSTSARAHAVAETIAAEDYHVADIKREHRPDGTPDVRYKDQTSSTLSSAWGGVSQAALETAIAAGRHTRLNFGSGLDILQSNIKKGIEPDLIANSKKRAMRVW